jgi:hypothetical protein
MNPTPTERAAAHQRLLDIERERRELRDALDFADTHERRMPLMTRLYTLVRERVAIERRLADQERRR